MITPQVHRTLLITPAYRDAALSLITAVAGEGQGGMFQVAVGADETITHYMSTGLIDEPFADILPMDEWDGEQYVRTREPDYEAIIAASGATQEHLEPILSAAVITAEGWKTTLYNLGLSL